MLFECRLALIAFIYKIYCCTQAADGVLHPFLPTTLEKIMLFGYVTPKTKSQIVYDVQFRVSFSALFELTTDQKTRPVHPKNLENQITLYFIWY